MQETITLAPEANAGTSRFSRGRLSAIAGFAVLAGDTTGNGTVSGSDIAQVKAQSGQAVTAANFRQDVNLSGDINASDIGFVKARSGSALP